MTTTEKALERACEILAESPYQCPEPYQANACPKGFRAFQCAACWHKFLTDKGE